MVGAGDEPGGRRSAQPDRTVAKDALTYEDLLKIVELVKSSPQFSEFRLKVGEIELHLRRKREGGAAGAAESTEAIAAAATAVSEARPDVRAGERAWPEHWSIVRSPMVGTFYRAPAPGERPFVETGQLVEAETTVCIIEVMKLMKSIPAAARGVVREILVADAQAVQSGQPLIFVEPQ